jgi:predicted N-acyltransferase
LAQENNFSSSHVLLADKSELNLFSDEGFSIRTSYSFHWFNNGYKDFEYFLKDMTSRQRKNIKKERQKIVDQNIEMIRLNGKEINREMLECFYQFYQVTYLKRGMRGYLNFEFFEKIIDVIPESILLVLAKNKVGSYVAGAFNFHDDKKLYGRYWGCLEEYDSLHFETCYYQGIEFCIEKGLESFDPGVQGEHKIKRGFCPIETYSAHWIRDIRFKEAIDDFLKREREHILEYNQDRKSLLPFRSEITSDLYEKI